MHPQTGDHPQAGNPEHAAHRQPHRQEDAPVPDSQVDDRVVYITPTEPVRTDPFLLLSEDWLFRPGLAWHPHRGLETVTLVLGGVLEHGDNLEPLITIESPWV